MKKKSIEMSQAVRPMPPEILHRLHERLDLNLMRTFLVIAQERNITRAAAKLFVTQSAVSQALRRLEDQLGCKLIVRSAPQFSLSPTGEKVFRIASELCETVRQINDAIMPSSETVTGTVRLLTISGVQSELYDDFLYDFHTRHPRISLEVLTVSSKEIINSIARKPAAIGIGLNRLPDANIAYTRLLQQRYAFYCGRRHRFFGREDLTVEDLAAENFVSFQADQIGAPLSSLAFFRDQKAFTGKVVASSPSFREVRRLIIAGYGIGCIPDHIAHNDLERGILWRLPPQEGVADADIFLLWNRQFRYSKAERVFLESFNTFLSDPRPSSISAIE